MDEELTLYTLLVASAGSIRVEEGEKDRNRTVWTKDWFLSRTEKVAYNMLLKELQPQDAELCLHYLRMHTGVCSSTHANSYACNHTFKQFSI